MSSASPARVSARVSVPSASAQQDPSSVDRVSLTAAPSPSYTSFLYALLGFTAVTLVAAAGYEYYTHYSRTGQRKKGDTGRSG